MKEAQRKIEKEQRMMLEEAERIARAQQKLDYEKNYKRYERFRPDDPFNKR